jgi:hypothetical protein
VGSYAIGKTSDLSHSSQLKCVAQANVIYPTQTYDARKAGYVKKNRLL